MVVRRATAVLLAALAALFTPTARGDVDAASAALRAKEFAAAVEQLASPPESDAVAALLRKLPPDDARGARLLAVHLRARGGHAAARGLRELVANRDAGVRELALRAIAQNGLRIDEGTDLVRGARDDDVRAVRDAAYAALAVVGDGSDVPSLLETTRSGAPNDVRGAYDALRGIAGVKFAYRDYLWRNWWHETKLGYPDRLRAALDALDAFDASARLDALTDARGVVSRTAWSDLRQVRERLASWLVSARPELRADAYRFAADLRLGDLAENVRWAQRCETDQTMRLLAGDCGRRLGVSVEPPPAPAREAK